MAGHRICYDEAEAYYLLAGATEASEDNLLGTLEIKKTYY